MSHKVEKFFKKFTPLKFKRGKIILKAGERVKGIYFLKRGNVRQYTESADGDSLTIHVFRPGSFFLMTWIVGEGVNKYYFEAVSPVEVYRAPVKDVVEFLKKEPSVLFDFTIRLLRGVNGILGRLENIIFDPAYSKVATLLSYFAKTFGESNGEGILIKPQLTHREIASWVGTTRETASIQIEKMVKSGVIKYKGRRIIISDLGKLQKESLSSKAVN